MENKGMVRSMRN